MSGRVCVIGARGYLGRTLIGTLAAQGFAVRGAGRGGPMNEPAFQHCDATDATALRDLLMDTDLVVNAMSGPPRAILQTAANLAAALHQRPALRLVQLSSLAVFGQTSGLLDESCTPRPARLHRYAAARLQSERTLLVAPAIASRCVVLRVGCIFGPGSPQWVDRICRMILAGRLGWLGHAGDGLSPLIHVRDVATAVAAALRADADSGLYHVLAPDMPIWNDYFAALASQLGLALAPRVGALARVADTWLAGPARAVLATLSGQPADLLTPAMVRLFRSRARPASRRRSLLANTEFTPLTSGIAEAVAAFQTPRRIAAAATGQRATT